MPNLQNLTPWKKGQSGNPKGKDRKYVTLLKDQGYRLGEINDTIQVMMSMTIQELKGVYDHPDATILEKTIANAMNKSLKNGSLYSMDTLLTRVYGKPRETIDTNNQTELKGKIEVVISKSEIPLSNRETDVDVSR
jgi:hypothetical protein